LDITLPDGKILVRAGETTNPLDHLPFALTLMHLGREAPPMMKDNGGAVALGRGRDIF